MVGAGPAGLAASTIAAERGHTVDLYESSGEIGGQFKLARVIPGKEDYQHTIRYYSEMIKKYGVHLHLNTPASAEILEAHNYDEVVLTTGVHPRTLDIKGVDHPKVVSYVDVLTGKVEVGKKVAIVGAGGIGFDVAEFLAHDTKHVKPSLDIPSYMKEWGVDMEYTNPGSLKEGPEPLSSPREIYLLKRSGGKHGKDLEELLGGFIGQA